MAPRFIASRLRPLSERELWWVAGLLEGEGSFMVVKRTVKGGLLSARARVAMQSTDHDVLLRLRETLGVGGIYPVGSRQGRKFAWQFAVQPLHAALALMRQLRPLMGIRRQAQIDVVLDEVSKVLPAA